jgi:glycosyltransferase involved in cell wall biosynthesis
MEANTDRPRILFLGNIAQNGYLITKFLRQTGYHADLLIYSYTHLMGQPEWEDADIRGDPPHWDAVWRRYVAGDYRRPDWIHEIRTHQPGRLRSLLSRLRIAPLVYFSAGNELAPDRREQLMAEFRRRLGNLSGDLRTTDFDQVLGYCNFPGIPRGFLGQYDLVIGAGPDAVLPLLLAPGRPFVAFEHGTMRDMPFEDSHWGRLLALAYTQADRCVITNPDCLASAKRLGLDNYQFVPHPVDFKYAEVLAEKPRCKELWGDARGPRVFAPARHDWAIKGNEMILRAFARFVRAAGQPNARLVLLEWGKEVDRSRALIQELGIGPQVLWRPVVSGKSLCRAMQSADVVIDQFVLGVFGSTVPQAMATGAPVISSYDEAKNAWAFPAAPPILRASCADEIAGHLQTMFADPQKRRAVGEAGRKWFQAHHSPQRVATAFEGIIRSVLEKRAQTRRQPCDGERREPHWPRLQQPDLSEARA